jgi:hypothetical protein
VGTLVLNAAFGDDEEREYAAKCLVAGGAIVGVVSILAYLASQD